MSLNKVLDLLGNIAETAVPAITSLLESKDVFNTKEASQILGLSEYTIRKKIRNKELKAEEDNARGRNGYSISKEELLKYQRNNPTSSTAPNPSTESADDALRQRITSDPALLERVITAQKEELELKELEYQKKELYVQQETDELDMQLMDIEIRLHKLTHAEDEKSSSQKSTSTPHGIFPHISSTFGVETIGNSFYSPRHSLGGLLGAISTIASAHPNSPNRDEIETLTRRQFSLQHKKRELDTQLLDAKIDIQKQKVQLKNLELTLSVLKSSGKSET